MERAVSFSSSGLRLRGTLSTPDSGDALAAVLLIPGSGQIDRDENKKGFQSDIFSELAAYLSDQQFASLRYDKRGIGESEGSYWHTGFFDHLEDASAALSFLETRPQLSGRPIFVLGHSEGAILSIRLAAEEMQLAGAILLAGSAQTGESTLHWQAAQIAKGLTGLNQALVRWLHIDVLKTQDKALRKIKRSTRDWILAGGFKRLNAKWMREFMAYDPADDLKRIRIPVLALTGSKDIQVNPADLERMAALVPGEFEYHQISDMTHVLRDEAGPPRLSSYKAELTRPIDPRLLEFIGGWLARTASAAAHRPASVHLHPIASN